MSPRAPLPTPRAPSYRPDLDGLRALAVLMVVVFHAAPELAPGGYLGVDVFFVLSGFLITGLLLHALQTDTFSYADFYARRVRRIAPALVVMLAGVWAYGAANMLVDDFLRLGQSLVGAATFSANYVAWRESGYFDVSAPFRPLLHLWSLAVEEQFYLVWPVALVAWVRATGRPRAGIVAALVLSLAGAVWLDRLDPAAAFYASPTRVWELLAGAALVTLTRPARSALGEAVTALAVCALVGLTLAARPEQSSAVALELGAVACALAVIQVGATSRIGTRLLSAAPVVAIGRVSYAWYLWHWPLLSIARLSSVTPVSAQTRAVLVVASLALAFATHHGIERPLTRALASGRVRRGWLWAGALASCVALVGVGAATWAGTILTTAQRAQRALLDRPTRDAVALREGACLIGRDKTFAGFAPECLPPTTAGAPSVLVWGDSYAASLAEGLRAQTSPPLAVSQLTVLACPPFRDQPNGPGPSCESLNVEIAQRLPSLRVDVLVVAADWANYGLPAREAGAKARTVLEQLKAHTQARLVLVGVQPTFPEAVPRLLARAGAPLPDRVEGGATEDARAMNDALRAAASEEGVAFADVMGALCDDKGCLVASGAPVADHLLTWDAGHLTAEGSRWVAEHGLVEAVLGR